jgi:tRNA1Val (adenine37-N6)-methyltransferase
MLVQFTKGGKPDLKILDPLYVYDENGQYTQQINDIYANQDIGEK